jgi:hypothetical protein
MTFGSEEFKGIVYSDLFKVNGDSGVRHFEEYLELFIYGL